MSVCICVSVCACVASVSICTVCGQAAAVRRCFAGAHDDDVDGSTEQATNKERERERNCSEWERVEERKTHTLAQPGQLIAPKKEEGQANVYDTDIVSVFVFLCSVAAKRLKR